MLSQNQDYWRKWRIFLCEGGQARDCSMNREKHILDVCSTERSDRAKMEKVKILWSLRVYTFLENIENSREHKRSFSKQWGLQSMSRKQRRLTKTLTYKVDNTEKDVRRCKNVRCTHWKKVLRRWEVIKHNNNKTTRSLLGKKIG